MFRVQDLVFRVQDLVFRVQDLVIRVEGWVYIWVQGSGFRLHFYTLPILLG